MKILLASLNAKYIHSSLAIKYLESYAKNNIEDLNIETMEFTINQNVDFIIGEIYKKKPDIIGFSCYIWNMNNTLRICEGIKIVSPETQIILGGPEVSFDSDKILKKYPYIDFIICGEGEETFTELIYGLLNNDTLENVKGIVYRYNNQIINNPARPLIKNLNIIPSPFLEDLSNYKNKIVYYESTRGCPFNCKFCLSSTIKGVRYFDIDRVKDDLDRLIYADVRQVKFVDRTFNANKKHAMEIMEHIIKRNPKDINFHFEITAHLLDEEILQFLEEVKEGLFQFEIGVQSTNDETLNAIGRNTDIEKIKYVTKRIKGYNNIHQHLDLIAGLPYEDYSSFKNSFNEIYELRPDKLQLGFLKVLKGSKLREEQIKYGFKYIDKPPYEVLENKYISYDEILKLKMIEDLVEKYANESVFENSLNFIIKNYYDSPFDFYDRFADYWERKGYHKFSHSRNKLYRILYDYFMEVVNDDDAVFKEIIRFDFILYNRNPNIPVFMKASKNNLNSYRHELLRDEEIIKHAFSQYVGESIKNFINDVYLEEFQFDILDFIKNGYTKEFSKNKRVVYMFAYKDGVLNKCDVYDVTKKIDLILNKKRY